MTAAVFNLLSIMLELLALTGVSFSREPGAPASQKAQGPSDEQLVELWRGGDRRAFELLIRRYQAIAFTVCRRYLANDQLAEETAQDVFISLYRKLGEFRGESSFKSWFYRVLTNHCHNRHKAGVRRKQDRHDSIDAPRADGDDRKGLELVDGALDPEAAMQEGQRQRLIERALESLPEESRMILLLREGQGLAYEDIAASLGLAVGTVKSRIHRARAELKAAVERLGGLS